MGYCGSRGGGVANLASAAGWLLISQLLWLIGNQAAADAAPIKVQQSCCL